jgi:predicted PurR-regulated permease PerM
MSNLRSAIGRKTTKHKEGSAGRVRSPHARTRPTQIRISKRTRNALLLASVVALVLLMWLSPSVPLMLLGGVALALHISFPVRALSRFMPRRWAILVSFLALVGLVIIGFVVLVPILVVQLVSFIDNVPGYGSDIGQFLRVQLEPLAERGLLPSTPEDLMSTFGQDLLNLAEGLAQQILGGLSGFISGTFNLFLTLFGVFFVAVYLISNSRKLKANFLRMWPKHYRLDARELWNTLDFSLSRYISGLVLVAFIQGALSAVGLFFLGVPYSLALGTWVAITSIIPYLGAYLGAIPAVILALFQSPTTALLTILLFLAIQMLEGNFLTPKIQGQTLQVPSVLIFLAVIAGGEIAGLLGAILAVPFVAMLRVLFDFFRARLCTSE